MTDTRTRPPDAADAAPSVPRIEVLMAARDWVGAEKALRALHQAHGATGHSANLLAVCLRRLGRPDEAVQIYRRILAVAGGEAGVWRNLGNALCDAHRRAESLAAHARALALDGLDPENWLAYGRALARADRPSDALAAFEKSLRRGAADKAAVRWDQALALLTLGRYAAAWPLYKARRALPGATPASAGEEWNGQSAPGRQLFITEEQGFGDVIQCLRYLPAVACLVGEVVVALRSPLARLLDPPPAPNLRVVAHGTPVPPGALRASILDLPGFFTPSPGMVPSPNGYLSPCGESLGRLAGILGANVPPEALRVGIVWSGSPTFSENAGRRAPLDLFLRHLALPGVRLVALQKGPPSAELAEARDHNVFDLGPYLADFADTAAACSLLDLVVTTDTAIVHLCGALGRPVWVLLGTARHWPWGLSGESTPWYRSVRLLRQASPGNWAASFDRVAADLLGMPPAAAAAERAA